MASTRLHRIMQEKEITFDDNIDNLPYQRKSNAEKAAILARQKKFWLRDTQRLLANKHVDPNQTDGKGNTALDLAIAEKKFFLVRELLKSDGVTLFDYSNHPTFLRDALEYDIASYGDPDYDKENSLINLFFKKKDVFFTTDEKFQSYVNTQDEKKENLFHLAARFGSTDLFDLLIGDKQVSTYNVFPWAETIEGKNILHLAAEHNNTSLFDYFFSKDKEDVLMKKIVTAEQLNHQDSHKKTPLHYAASRPNGGEMVKHLLDKRESQKKRNVVFYQENDSLNQDDDQGKTPLDIAIESRAFPAILQLLEKNAEMHFYKINETENNENREPLLHDVIRAGDVPLLTLLLDKEKVDKKKSQAFDAAVTNSGQTSTLHVAVQSKNLESLKTILKYNRILTHDKNNQNILHYYAAGETYHPDLFEVLKDSIDLSGTTIEQLATEKANGKTPIDIAIQMKNFAVIHQLLPYSQLDAKKVYTLDPSGKSLLHYAALNGDIEIFMALIKIAKGEGGPWMQGAPFIPSEIDDVFRNSKNEKAKNEYIALIKEHTVGLAEQKPQAEKTVDVARPKTGSKFKSVGGDHVSMLLSTSRRANQTVTNVNLGHSLYDYIQLIELNQLNSKHQQLALVNHFLGVINDVFTTEAGTEDKKKENIAKELRRNIERLIADTPYKAKNELSLMKASLDKFISKNSDYQVRSAYAHALKHLKAIFDQAALDDLYSPSTLKRIQEKYTSIRNSNGDKVIVSDDGKSSTIMPNGDYSLIDELAQLSKDDSIYTNGEQFTFNPRKVPDLQKDGKPVWKVAYHGAYIYFEKIVEKDKKRLLPNRFLDHDFFPNLNKKMVGSKSHISILHQAKADEQEEEYKKTLGVILPVLLASTNNYDTFKITDLAMWKKSAGKDVTLYEFGDEHADLVKDLANELSAAKIVAGEELNTLEYSHTNNPYFKWRNDENYFDTYLNATSLHRLEAFARIIFPLEYKVNPWNQPVPNMFKSSSYKEEIKAQEVNIKKIDIEIKPDKPNELVDIFDAIKTRKNADKRYQSIYQNYVKYTHGIILGLYLDTEKVEISKELLYNEKALRAQIKAQQELSPGDKAFLKSLVIGEKNPGLKEILVDSAQMIDHSFKALLEQNPDAWQDLEKAKIQFEANPERTAALIKFFNDYAEQVDAGKHKIKSTIKEDFKKDMLRLSLNQVASDKTINLLYESYTKAKSQHETSLQTTPTVSDPLIKSLDNKLKQIISTLYNSDPEYYPHYSNYYFNTRNFVNSFCLELEDLMNLSNKSADPNSLEKIDQIIRDKVENIYIKLEKEALKYPTAAESNPAASASHFLSAFQRYPEYLPRQSTKNILTSILEDDSTSDAQLINTAIAEIKNNVKKTTYWHHQTRSNKSPTGIEALSKKSSDFNPETHDPIKFLTDLTAIGKTRLDKKFAFTRQDTTRDFYQLLGRINIAAEAMNLKTPLTPEQRKNLAGMIFELRDFTNVHKDKKEQPIKKISKDVRERVLEIIKRDYVPYSSHSDWKVKQNMRKGAIDSIHEKLNVSKKKAEALFDQVEKEREVGEVLNLKEIREDSVVYKDVEFIIINIFEAETDYQYQQNKSSQTERLEYALDAIQSAYQNLNRDQAKQLFDTVYSTWASDSENKKRLGELKEESAKHFIEKTLEDIESINVTNGVPVTIHQDDGIKEIKLPFHIKKLYEDHHSSAKLTKEGTATPAHTQSELLKTLIDNANTAKSKNPIGKLFSVREEQAFYEKLGSIVPPTPYKPGDQQAAVVHAVKPKK